VKASKWEVVINLFRVEEARFGKEDGECSFNQSLDNMT